MSLPSITDASESVKKLQCASSRPSRTFDNAPAQHATLTQNFVDAILDGEPLVAPGAEGMNSVELANSMLFSSLAGQTIELPLNGAAYEAKLQQLITESRFEKKVVEINGEDFTKSFVR